MKKFFLVTLILLLSLLIGCTPSPQKNKKQLRNATIKPNIVLIYVNDLGYSDISCYGAKGVSTPNVDRLAENGIRFTDAHSSSATCTPSRYSLLTGTYAFRNKADILPGDAPLIIRPGTPTLPNTLQKAGYKTAVIGKWHLGLGNGDLDWNTTIKPGPNEIGFDYNFLIPATGDRVPCVYVENDQVVGLDPNDPITVSYKKRIENEPTGLLNPELLKVKADLDHSDAIVNGISRIGYMTGGEKALWVDEEIPLVMTSKAKTFIANNKEEPFFLFFSFHDINVPRLPHQKFIGKSTMGPRGDAIAQMDWCTGEIIKELEKHNLDKNTLIIFTSDNGPVLNDGYDDDAVEKLGNHNPSGPFRGGKYSAFESGTRVPTITYWPGIIKPSTSDALMTQVDLFASLAQLVNKKVELEVGIDSENFLDTFLGHSKKGREFMIEESYTLSLRHGKWKYIAPLNSEQNIPEWILTKKNIEPGLMKEPQLYNLFNDKSEKLNLAFSEPLKVTTLQNKLNEIITKK